MFMAEYYLYGWTPHTCVPLLLHSRQVVPDKHVQNAQCKEKGLPVRSRSGEILDQNGIASFLSVFLCPCKWLSFWAGEGTVHPSPGAGELQLSSSGAWEER